MITLTMSGWNLHVYVPGDKQLARDGKRRLRFGHLRQVEFVCHYCYLTGHKL